MIVLAGGIKGGSGKSTVAVNLASMLALGGHEVLLVDADQQATAKTYTDIRSERLASASYTCVQLVGAAVRTEIAKLRRKYEHVVIDAGGRDTISQRAAMVCAHKMLIPFLPRSFDLWSLEPLLGLIDEARSFNPALICQAFLSRADATGTDNAEAAKYLSTHEQIAYLDSPIANRKSVANAASMGLCAWEHRPIDPKARAEWVTLFECVFDFSFRLA